MKAWILFAAAATVVVAAVWWHWPANAQGASRAATAGEVITFEQYREFRIHDLQQRQGRLARQLAAPGLSTAEKADLDRRKAYYDELAAMPAEKRDQIYRERFDQIDANRDGQLDTRERFAWREKQREHYRQQAAERAGPAPRQ